MTEQDPILDKARQLRAAGATVDEVRQYLHSKGYDTGDAPAQSHAQRLHDEYKVGNLARRMASENDQDAAELEPTGIADAGARAFMATGANLAQGIPGMSAVQAFLRSKVRGQSYGEALSDIQGETSKIPEPLRNIEKAVGAAPLALSLPGSTLAKAATTAGTLGWAGEMADADPDVSLEERTKRAPIAGATSAAITGAIPAAASTADKVRRFLGLANRVRNAPTVGQAAVDTDKAITKATKENYGQLAEEAKASAERPTTEAVQKAFEDPDVSHYVGLVRASRRFKNADDATVAREADKLMTRQRREWKKQIEAKDGQYDASLDIKVGDLSDAQKVLRRALSESGVETTTIPAPTTAQSPPPSLRDALSNFDKAKGVAASRTEGTVEQQMARKALERHHAENVVSPPLRGSPTESVVESEIPPMLPSHPHAVAEKARMEGERAAEKEAATMGSRIARGLRTNPKNAETKSPEAYLDKVSDGERMPQNEAQAAARAFLSGLKEDIKRPEWTPNQSLLGLLKGAARPVQRLNRVGPYVDALDRAAGNPVSEPLDVETVRRMMPALSQEILKYFMGQAPSP